jgi:hypothetical protein
MGVKTKIKHALRRRSIVRVRKEPGRGDWPDGGGVREPLRPKNGPPSDAISLPEPK